MTFFYATKGKRFLTYIIDFWILSFASSYIGRGIELLCGIDPDSTNTYYQLLYNEAINLLSGGGSEDSLMYYYGQYLSHSMVDNLFSLGALLILIVGLLVILPIFFKGRTLGRWACHLTLVNNKGQAATAKNFIIREIVGTFLFYGVFGFIGIIISLIMLLAKNRSLVDMISGTHLVFENDYVDSRTNQTFDNNGFSAQDDSNTVESDWTEVKEDEDDSSDDGEDYKII